jgi:magnesium chelatase family protein
MGLALPNKRITVNLAPADLLKEGSHFDLPIAIGLLAAMDALPMDEIGAYMVLGELGLEGGLTQVTGAVSGGGSVFEATACASQPTASGWLPGWRFRR